MKLKRITGLILCLIMIFNICGYTRNNSTFDYLMSQNSELITRLNDAGLTNTRINSFLSEMDEEADKLNPTSITELEQFFIFTLFVTVFDKEEFSDVLGAFDIAFQEEIQMIYENMGQGKWVIPEAFNEFFMSVMFDKIKPEIPPVYEPEPEPEIPPSDDVVVIPPPVPVFGDVSDDYWGYEHILSLYERKIVDGYVGKIFKPENKVTRAELAKTVCKAFLNDKFMVSESRYTDIDDSLWYSEFVKVCEYYNIFDKICDTAFSGGQYVTRQEMCTVIYRAFHCSQKTLITYDKQEFLDKHLFAPYATQAIENLQWAGIVNGFEDFCFHPFNETTRAEVCKVVNLLLNQERTD